MPIQPNHIINFLNDANNEKLNVELLDLFITRINQLCFEQCQIDRIQCTLSPQCRHRFLLSLRIKNGLTIDDLPKFCYSIHKNLIMRDFRRKTIVYKPHDAYLYLIDFLDVFFHGDYRKLNKFVSFQNWDEVKKMLNDRIENQKENFTYHITKNFMIFQYEDQIHVINLTEKYALCNAKTESIKDLELLEGLFGLFKTIYFPDVEIELMPEEFVEILIRMPNDVISSVKEVPLLDGNSKLDSYFWKIFPNDIEALIQFCKEIHLDLDENDNLIIKLDIGLESNSYVDGQQKLQLRFRDLRLIKNFIYRLYNEFYIIWL